MRISLLGPTYPFRGGISHYTTLLCTALRRDHDVQFISLTRQYPRLLFPGRTQKDDSSEPLWVRNDACVDSVNPLSWLRAALRIRAYGADLMVISWWHPFFAMSFGSVAHLAWRLGRIPACYLCHNVLPHEASRTDRLLLRYAFAAGAGFITHSEADAEVLRGVRAGVPVRHSPHPSYDVFAANAALSADDAKRALGLQGRNVLLFFGYVRPYKGLAHLLDAIMQLPRNSGYHLLLVGEFYERHAVYAKALDVLVARGQLTLVDRYVPNEDVHRYFRAADIVMVPYETATQSGIVQIAYGFGLPVVATRVGGLPEVVRDQETGYLVPAGDSGAIVAAVRRYFEKDRKESFAANIARERERFSWAGMVATIEAVATDLAPEAADVGE